jgi:hypothetical protein
LEEKETEWEYKESEELLAIFTSISKSLTT